MELRRFCSQSRVVIVAGKGGVGKTTVTAALALAATRAGLRVLIAEVEGKSGLAAAFGAPPLGYEESQLAPGVFGRTLSPDAALIDYLVSHGLKRISKRLAHSGALDVVATAVPGMKDILVLGKVKSLEQSGEYDLVLVDAPAAGHAITFLLAARGLLEAVTVGPVRKQAQDVAELLNDPARCQVMLVTLPEETPVNELVDTAFAIEDRAGVALGPVVVNACDTEPALAALDRVGVQAVATHAGMDLDPATVGALADAAAFRHARAQQQAAQCARLAEQLPLPQLVLPFMFTAAIGPDELARLTDALVRGIEALP
jgi:Mrp family chromosome partitioning ATPase